MTRHIRQIGNRKVGISERMENRVDPRYRLLVRIQGMLIKHEGGIVWRDGRFFDTQLGKKVIDKFLTDGVISTDWVNMLGKYSEWTKILRLFYKDFVVIEADKDKSLKEIANSKGNTVQNQKSEFISRSQNNIVLSALLIKAGLRGDLELAEAFNVEIDAIRFMRKGRDLISKRQLAIAIRELGLPKEGFKKWL